MPSRNVKKLYEPESFYHIYARGNTKQPIFHEDRDYLYFIDLFERYLSISVAKNEAGRPYPHYGNSIHLLSFCLMKNHFHMLVYQKHTDAMSLLMHCIMTSYSRYFNLKYKRTGSLFENRYKASLITNQSYLEHISRYIHLNPRYWRKYPYSSLPFYTGEEAPEWIHIGSILELFADSREYYAFLEEYEEHKYILEEIKESLADQ